MSDRRLVVGAVGVTQILAWGSSTYLPALLNAPVVADTGWPLAWVAGGLSAGQFMAAAVSPCGGLAIGELGSRTVLAISALVMAIGLATIGAAPNLIVYVLGWTIVGGEWAPACTMPPSPRSERSTASRRARRSRR